MTETESKLESGYTSSNPAPVVEGLDLHFSRLEKEVTIKKGGGGLLSTDTPDAGEIKKILKNVSGEARAGQVLALMGPSGSGKTTLLDVLAGRGPFQAGSVTVNKAPLSKDMKRSIAYVMQSDLFFEHLTVRDTLTYTALLRLPGEWSRERKLQEVEQVVKRLRLGSCVNTPIMLVSGGEKKRTNIGTELLTNPKILLLDEPTSGLDSTSAVALMNTLKNLASEGRTILTSIHQPSSGVFASFNRLLLLADGCVIYNGTPQGSLEYFSNLGYPCPDGYNAADHCMDLLVVDSATDNNDGKTSTRSKLIAEWDSEAGASLVEQSRNKLSDSKRDAFKQSKSSAKKYESSYLTQMSVLTHRCLKNKRSALFTKINFLKSVGLGLICGTCFWQMEDTEELVLDRAGFAFFAMTYWIFDSMFEAMMAFPGERSIIEKERSSGSYHLSAYFLSKTFSEAPCRILMPSIYIIISYFMANMRLEFASFIGFATAELLGVLVGESIGLLIGATVMDFEQAIMVMTLVSLSLMLTGGYFVENIPGFFSWTQYFSPFKYAYDACLIIEFSGRRTDCDGSGKIPACDNNNYGSVSGEDVMKFLNVQGSLGFNMGMMVVLFFAIRFFAYVALRLHSNANVRG